jgi:hypothetical protein
VGWYEAIKDAVTVADRLRDAELKQKLADVQIECAKLAEENASLRQENLALREKERLRIVMVFRDNVYWRERPDAEPEGPFCPACLDGQSRTARMIASQSNTTWICATCHCAVGNPHADPPKPVQRYRPRSSWL